MSHAPAAGNRILRAATKTGVGGVLGSQIAYQAAYVGMDVTIWLRSEGSIDRAKPKIDRVHKVCVDTLSALKPQVGQAVPAPKGMVPDIEHTTPEDFDVMRKDQRGPDPPLLRSHEADVLLPLP